MNISKNIFVFCFFIFLTACSEKTVKGDTVTIEVQKPAPVITQLESSCDKKCGFTVLVNKQVKTLTVELDSEMYAILEIDGGYREPIVNGNMITYNVTGYLSPEMTLFVSSNSYTSGSVWLHSYEYFDSDGGVIKEVIDKPNKWFVDFQKVKVSEVTLDLFASNGTPVKNKKPYYILDRESTEKMFLNSVYVYATSLKGDRFRHIGDLDGNQVNFLLPKGEYTIDISAGWEDEDHKVDFYRNFTLIVDSYQPIQKNIKLQPKIYEEATWNILKDNFDGSLHKENVFNHYENSCTVGNKYNKNVYVTRNAFYHFWVDIFCIDQFNPEIESINVISTVDAILKINNEEHILEENIEKNIQLNLFKDEIYFELSSNEVGAHTFQILGVNYSNFGSIEAATMGDDITQTFTVMEKGELIPQNSNEITKFVLLGEYGEIMRVCVSTELSVEDFNLSINKERTLRYSDSTGNEHCYYNYNSDYTITYKNIELNFDSLSQNDKITFTSLLLKGNDSEQDITWKLEE
ncbi:MAG: hypothetical protein GY828_02135 [Candidatus Gracilibacteria bacterium]|nr:hypothetical protein [Candidatus Gracilibacteria bacterium]